VLLELEGVSKRFGGLMAVNKFSMAVAEGEIVALLGPNGSGKTTLFNTITGVCAPDEGTIQFQGRTVGGMRPYEVAKLGIGRTFQMNPLFSEFTVLENITSSFHLRPKSTLIDVYFNTRRYRRNEAEIAESARQILDLLHLTDRGDQLAKNLPHAFMKLLGVGRALATRPKLLLLDEPLGGMNPEEIKFCIERFRDLRDNGMTLVIVEHNMQILRLSDRVVVMSFGQKLFEGSPDDVKNNEEVISAYFGAEDVTGS
jgi:branched-chain amino acid transport system ATP-binding protein